MESIAAVGRARTTFGESSRRSSFGDALSRWLPIRRAASMASNTLSALGSDARAGTDATGTNALPKVPSLQLPPSACGTARR